MQPKGKHITTIEELTLQWLDLFIRSRGFFGDAQVESIKFEKNHYTGRYNFHELKLELVDRLKRDYMPYPSQKYSHIEWMTSLMVKDYQPNLPLAKKTKVGARKEVQFYHQIYQQIWRSTQRPTIENPMPLPVMVYAHHQEKPFNSLLILRNYSHSHQKFTSKGKLENSECRLTNIHLTRAIESLARFHAFWWDYPNLATLIPKNPFNKNIKFRDSITVVNQKETFMKYYMRVGKILESWINNDSKIEKKRKQLYRKCYRLYPELLWQRIQQKKTKNLTLIHGDAHPFQFFYPKNINDPNEKVILADWEAWSINIGAFDLAYMMGLFFTPEFRKNTGLVEKSDLTNLIKLYHSTLQKNGITTYSFEDCYADFRLGLVNNFYIPIWNMNRTMFRELAVQYFEEFTCRDLYEDVK